MAAKPTTIDEYLAGVSADKRGALERLRRAIRSAAPNADECISYGLAAFRLDGRALVAFGATAKHCSFFPMNSTTVDAFKDELKRFDTSKGTIRFQADKPLPTALVRKLVKARIAENAGVGKGRVTGKKPASVKAPAGSKAVDDFLRELDHPLKPVLQAVRAIILGVSPKITEGIKWNAPSFHFHEYFASAGLQAGDFVRIVFHMGAKVKDNATARLRIADPQGLLEWHANERCSARFHDLKEVKSKAGALRSIVTQWIKRM